MKIQKSLFDSRGEFNFSLTTYTQRNLMVYPDRGIVRGEVADLHLQVADTLHEYYVDKPEVYEIVNKWIAWEFFGQESKDVRELWGVPENANLADYMATWQLIGKAVALYLVDYEIQQALRLADDDSKAHAIQAVREFLHGYRESALQYGIDFSRNPKEPEIDPVILFKWIANYDQAVAA